MRPTGRKDDLVLLAGLIVALLVIVSPALGQLLAIVQEIEQGQGRRLLQALLILATVLVFHQSRKRHEIRAQALVSAAAARQANERAIEMERLVAFGEALARSLDMDSIQQAVASHIPLLAPGRNVWAMIRTGSHWKLLAAIGDSTPLKCERAARRAIGEPEAPGAEETDDTCFPMIVAGHPIGVLGVETNPPVTDQHRRVLSAAAALLGASLENADLYRVVRENSVRDPLTGCFNRRYAIETIDAELRRSRRSHLPLSLVMFDIDHFKRTNDRFGHMAGDAVLATVGARMKAVLRGSDLKCRMGGEEFLILLPDTPLDGARHVAEALRREFADKTVQWNDVSIAVTASFGVTTVTPGERDALAIIERADAALYRAKEEGRNCVRVSEEAAEAVV
jgi:diguanylate cyclase (GGDEF)-like protein